MGRDCAGWVCQYRQFRLERPMVGWRSPERRHFHRGCIGCLSSVYGHRHGADNPGAVKLRFFGVRGCNDRAVETGLAIFLWSSARRVAGINLELAARAAALRRRAVLRLRVESSGSARRPRRRQRIRPRNDLDPGKLGPRRRGQPARRPPLPRVRRADELVLRV